VGFVGNNGTLVVDRGGWEVIPEYRDNSPLIERVELQKSSGNGLDLHMKNFLACLEDRSKTPIASIQIGANISRVANLGNIAYKTGRRLYWDGSANKFINDQEADAYLLAKYRKPWELPMV
jgi:hypothetical protein